MLYLILLALVIFWAGPLAYLIRQTRQPEYRAQVEESVRKVYEVGL